MDNDSFDAQRRRINDRNTAQRSLRLTAKEREAIDALEALSRNWPSSLWLFSANGSLLVMKKRNGIRAVEKNGSMDSNAAVATIEIENDGGDF